MSTLLSGLLSALALLVLLPALVLSAQVLLACLPARRSAPAALGGQRAALAVLVPAHDEAPIIRATLASIALQLQAQDRLLVVADNCSDDTAALARACGAEVVERTDPLRRGKGYALDFGIRQLACNPPPVLVIVDADCQLAAGALDHLARCCLAEGRPAQALYLMQAPPQAGVKVLVAEFAWRVKNLVRAQGFARIGLPCQLTGTGMAFAWQDLAGVSLASGHLVEDLKLGLDFCRIGKAPVFCPQALVSSQFPASEEGLSSQRTRWEHGHLGMLLSDAPGLLASAVRQRNWPLLAMSVDLLVPPLALLTLATVVLCGLGWLVWLLFGSVAPALIASLALGLLSAAVLLAWWRFARERIGLAVLIHAPLYAVKKIPLYLGFLVRRQVEWVRSKRDEP